MQVLVVDPDPRMQRSLSEGLRQPWSGAQVLCAGTGEGGLQLFRRHRPDVVLLATALPDGLAFDILREIRRVSDAPVLLLADNNADADQILGVQLGADDYVVQPVSAVVLAARINAVLRRGAFLRPGNGQVDFQAGPLSMSFRKQEVTVAGVPVALTPLEFQLLHHLVRRAGEVVTSEELLDHVWGREYGATTKYLKVFINRLRSKLARAGTGRWIETKRGVGYRFVDATRDAGSVVGDASRDSVTLEPGGPNG